MKVLLFLKNKFKAFRFFLASILIGNFYTEEEALEVVRKMQYEIAQKIVGNRNPDKPIIPMEFFLDNGKYDNYKEYNIKNRD